MILVAISFASSGVRLELASSPRGELSGAVGIFSGEKCYMASAGRIENEHYIACYSETVLSVSVGNHFGFWGAKQIGGGYISKKIDKCGAYAGLAVGVYYRFVNLHVFYSSITYIENSVYRLSGQIYIGLAVEFDY